MPCACLAGEGRAALAAAAAAMDVLPVACLEVRCIAVPDAMPGSPAEVDDVEEEVDVVVLEEELDVEVARTGLAAAAAAVAACAAEVLDLLLVAACPAGARDAARACAAAAVAAMMGVCDVGPTSLECAVLAVPAAVLGAAVAPA